MFPPHRRGWGLIDGMEAARRRAFSHWLRTGWLPTVVRDGIEHKFNPHHDPDDGRFTFAPGGPRSLERVVISDRKPRHYRPAAPPPTASTPSPTSVASVVEAGSLPALSATDADPSTDRTDSPVELALLSRPPRSPRGSNIRAFEDPMTLEQAVTGLARSPAGVLLPVVDNVLDLFGPARLARSQILDNNTRGLVGEI